MVVMAHAVGSPEFYWAIVAEVSLLVWTGLLLVAPRLSGPGGDRRRFRVVGFAAALLAALITLAGSCSRSTRATRCFPAGTRRTP